MAILSEQETTLTPLRVRVPSTLPLVALAIDAGVITGAALLALAGRRSELLFTDPANVSASLIMAGPAICAAWLVTIYLAGGYGRDVFGVGSDEFRRVLRGTMYCGAVVGIGCYLAKFPLARGYYFLLFALGAPALLLARVLFRRTIQTARRRGLLQQRILLSGSPKRIDEIAHVLSERPWLGYRVVGALTPTTHRDEETPAGVPVLGDIHDVALCAAHEVDVLLFAGGANVTAYEMRRSIWSLEHSGVEVVLAPNLADVSGERLRFRPIGGLPLVHVDPPTWHAASRLGKRLFDVVGALALLVVASPVLLASAVWIKVHDRGPVLFRQERIGRDREPFNVLKLRSMVADAEDRLASLHEETGHEGGLFKMKDDPRITGPGRTLRRYSIDELPQLLNVLRGDMSLVGPRPPLPQEVVGYDEEMARRLHVRPGLTGLWQVSGRSDLSFDEAIQLDLYYVDNWSILQDLAILVRTIGAVLGSRGAY